MKKQRDSGIEVLRICAILMVICVHVFLYGNYYEEAMKVDGIVASSALFAELLVRACVNIFVIITGYFMINSTAGFKKSYKRLLKFYAQVLFYSVTLTAIAVASGVCKGEMLVNAVLKGIFPISGQLWYFITDYVLLCLFAPFINICLKKITKKQFQALILIMTAVLSFWVAFAKVWPFSLWVSNYGYEGMAAGKNVFSFSFIYILGAYIGMYWEKSEKPKWRYLAITAGCVLLSYVLICVFDESKELFKASTLYSYPLIIGVAVSLLLFFKDWHFHSRLINLLGSTTLGVYAIHEFKYVRSDLIWKIFNFEKVNNENLLINILRIIAVVLIVFLVCAAIDLVRQQLFGFVEKIINSRKKKAIK